MRRSRVTFVLEQQLGHRTFATNLRDVLGECDDVAASVVDVDYEGSPGLLGAIPWDAWRVTLRGRAEVVAGLRQYAPADVRVYNTQVPAAIALPYSVRRPYVLSTDVTPAQLDRIAIDYEHRADRRGPLRWAKYRLNRWVFQRASLCVPWSDWARRSLIDDYGVDPRRVEVIPPGIDLARWSPSPRHSTGPLRVLFVGGDFRRKGGDVLLAALEDVSPETVTLDVVSHSDVPVRRGVTVHRDLRANDQRLIELYRSSDVFVLPSRAETFGIAAVEAAAVGLPLVLSNVGGLAELVIDGETGRRVPVNDRDALASVLCGLAADREMTRRYGAAARARAEVEFDVRRNTRRLLDLAIRCVDQGRSSTVDLAARDSVAARFDR